MPTPDLMQPITHVLDHYVAARSTPFAQTPMRHTVQQIASGIETLVAPISPQYQTDYSIGKGSWAFHPWVASYSSSVTATVRHGICVGMSWNADMSGFAYGLFIGRDGLSEYAGKQIDAHAIERFGFITQAAGTQHVGDSRDAHKSDESEHVVRGGYGSPIDEWYVDETIEDGIIIKVQLFI